MKEIARNAIAATSREALALVSTDEATKASRFFFHRDAKLSLGSSLLKRYFVVNVFSDGAKTVPRMPEGRLATRRLPMRVRVPASTEGSDQGKLGLVEPWWDEVRFGRRGGVQVDGMARGKPCYEAVSGDDGDRIDFNTTHQAGLVLLAGLKFSREHSYSIGVDVTCVSERYSRDLEMIEQEGGGVRGFRKFVGMHEEIFSDGDIAAIQADEIGKVASSEGHGANEGALKAKLRRFYAFWALKEAYVKMEGEALLAEWLRDIEFRNVRVPKPGRGNWESSGIDGTVISGPRPSVWDKASALGLEFKKTITGGTPLPGRLESAWGETINNIEVYVRGIRREDIQMFLLAFEGEYLVSTAVLRHEGMAAIAAPVFHHVDVERDIFPVARRMDRSEAIDDIANAA